jgi:hypothetical protein
LVATADVISGWVILQFHEFQIIFSSDFCVKLSVEQQQCSLAAQLLPC